MILEKLKASPWDSDAFGIALAWDSSDKSEHTPRARIIKKIARRCRISEAAAHVVAELAGIGGGARL